MKELARIRHSTHGQSMRVSVYVQPNGRVSGISGQFGQSLKIKIAAQPSDGAANEALREFVAEILGITSRQVDILQCSRSHHKILGIDGFSIEEILAKLRV
jgi:uncharacterized protein YggU (UPF0235/DUF167 family)